MYKRLSNIQIAEIVDRMIEDGHCLPNEREKALIYMCHMDIIKAMAHTLKKLSFINTKDDYFNFVHYGEDRHIRGRK